MRVLVTGGAGFIGANFVRFMNYNSPDIEISVIDDLSSGSAENLDGLRLHFVEGSILDEKSLRAALEDVDSVVHLAAIGSVPKSVADPISSHQANSTGTLLLLEECKRLGVPHVIVASSSSVYGSNPRLPKRENDWTRPLSPYGVSKLATEAYAIAFQHTYGLHTLALRFFNVFGPLQRPGHAYAAVIPRFMNQAIDGLPLTVHGDGNQTRDFTNVLSVCQVLDKAIRKRIHSLSPVNVAFGTQTSIVELVDLIAEVTGLSVRVVNEPGRPGDIEHSVADPKSFQSLFGSQTPIPLVEGLRTTFEWMDSLRKRP